MLNAYKYLHGAFIANLYTTIDKMSCQRGIQISPGKDKKLLFLC